LQYLGLQDVPRKRRPPVQTPGAWAGLVFITTDMEVLQTVAQSKWDKAKALVVELLHMMVTSPNGLLNYKRLEEIRGFLGNIAMAYTTWSPLISGACISLWPLTILSKNSFGWKMATREWAAYLYKSVKSRKKFTVMEAKLMAEAAVELTPSPELRTGQVFPLPTLQEGRPPHLPPKTIAAVPRLGNEAQVLL
jgi:hypothetical protein